MIDTLVRDYLRAAAALYGCIRLYTLYAIFTHHNGGQISAETFYRLARKAEAPYETFRIIGDDDIYRADISIPDMDRWLVHRQYCYAIWDSLFTLENNHEGKMIHLLPKEEMLSYADPTYVPHTPQMCELGRLLQKHSDNQLPLSQILRQAFLLARDDCNAVTFLEEMQRLGCRFGSLESRTEAVNCYKKVYDTVPKPIHNGNTELEIRTVLKLRKPLQRYYLWYCSPTQKDSFYDGLQQGAVQLPSTGITEHQRFLDRCLQSQTLPTRLFDSCPCGSGLYYTDCCGKR